MIRTTIVIAAALGLAVMLAPAQAQVPRTFVSAAGSDGNNCSNVTTPCRHFAAAYAATAPGGEIFVLDPSNYGSLTITHSVSIEGHGWASIAPPNGGIAITINAGAQDTISIHGVAVNGTGATGLTYGIVFNSGGGLTVTDCVVQNFSGDAILIQPTSKINFLIKDTILLHNAGNGIDYTTPSGSTAAGTGVIDHVVVANSAGGIIIATTLGGGLTSVTIANSIANENLQDGVFINNGIGSPLAVSIDSSTFSSNGNNGITGNGSSKITLGRSVITANRNSGIDNQTIPNTFYTYGNNQIDLNIIDVAGTALNTTLTPR
jgi:hypothetical protein